MTEISPSEQQRKGADGDPSEAAKQRVKDAGERAKAEAAARREASDAAPAHTPKEVNGRGGLDPVRYEDWEIKGLTADF